MKMKPIYFILLAFMIHLTSCKKDEFPLSQRTLVEKLEFRGNEADPLSVSIDWEKSYSLIDPDDEASLSLHPLKSNATTLTKGNLQGGAPTKIYSFVVVSSEGELSGYIDLIPFSSQLTAVESLIGGNFSGNLLASFNGYYIRSDLDGFDWKWLVLRGGKVDGTGQPGLDMLVLDPVCDEYSVNVWTQTCWYQINGDGSTFFLDCSEWVITNTLHFKDCSGVPSDIYGTNYVYSSGGGGQNGNSSNSNSTSDSAFANIRDTLDLDCLKHVIRDYINNRFFNSQLSQNFLPFLQALDTLQGFEMTILFKDEVLPIHDLGDEIAMEHHGFHNPGYTSLIRISNQLETSTQEIIISTAVHEVLHSYLRAVRQYCLPIFRGGGDGNPDNFPFMARFYQLDSLGYKQNIWHELIAENFINVIVDAIQAFNPSYPTDRAYALAWGGLHETDAYENATDKPTIPFIIDVNNQEKLVSESSQGIPCD